MNFTKRELANMP